MIQFNRNNHMKKTLKIIGFVFIGLLLVYGVLFVHEMYYPSPTSKFISSCEFDWQAKIRGICDKKGKYNSLTKEDLNWLMKHEQISKETIIKYAEHFIEFEKGEIKEYEQKGILTDDKIKQIKHLEEIIKTLQEQ